MPEAFYSLGETSSFIVVQWTCIGQSSPFSSVSSKLYEYVSVLNQILCKQLAISLYHKWVFIRILGGKNIVIQGSSRLILQNPMIQKTQTRMHRANDYV